MSAVCIIPARGGSRRIPRKNIKLFHGKPIIAYSIEAAKESGLFNSIMVTTDDPVIGFEAGKYGAEHVSRPEALALDEVGTQEVARWVLKDMCAPNHYQHACVVYPCAPMMTAKDLEVGFALLTGGVYGAYAYVPGWFYWGTTRAFLDGVPLDPIDDIIISDNRYIDINTPEDFSRAEEMYKALHPEVA